MSMYEVYVHIPFCRSKCWYCDFASHPGMEKYFSSYVNALDMEIQSCSDKMKEKGSLHTVYIGGGTPTVLPKDMLCHIIGSIGEYFGSYDDSLTVEANPGTVNEDYMLKLLEAGANRISIGVQSFSDRLLKRIGRIHDGAQAVRAVRDAQSAGFNNISIDLMYGLPGQSLRDLIDSVNKALDLGIQHISIYGLQLEDGTVFSRQKDIGRLELPDDETEEQMYDYITSVLPSHGFRRYEISNYAQPGFESKHNLGYWHDVPYIGLGAAAHSYDGIMRYENCSDVTEYIRLVSSGDDPSSQEEASDMNIRIEEYAFLALRTADGISMKSFESKFDRSFNDVYGAVVKKLTGRGYLKVDGDNVHMTRLGAKWGNVVFREFLL